MPKPETLTLMIMMAQHKTTPKELKLNSRKDMTSYDQSNKYLTYKFLSE
jgi:hypothetical protein